MNLSKVGVRVSATVGLLLAIGGSACSQAQPPASKPSPAPSSSTSTMVSAHTRVNEIDWVEYVNDAITQVEEAYFDPGSVDWDVVRSISSSIVEESLTQSGAHRALIRVFGPRGFLDSHSSFVTPVQFQGRPSPGELPRAQLVEGDIGSLELPGVRTGFEGLETYASVTHDLARELDEDGVCGWIVDLRANQGGSGGVMWLAVGPLLGGEDFLAFAKVGEEPTGWHSYSGGRILVDGEPLDQHFEGRLAESFMVSDPFTPSDPDAPVAVLTSSFTASAAESVVVAFKGRSHTAFFGEPTGGFTTGVVNFRLPDGAVLNVSAGYPVDRDGHRYEQAIQPDEQFLYLPDHPEDAALERATEWLMDQQACL